MRKALTLVGLVGGLCLGCSEKLRPTIEGNCMQVYYDAGGRRAVATGDEVVKFSDTHVRVTGVRQSGGRVDSAQGNMDITSAAITIREGSCYP